MDDTWRRSNNLIEKDTVSNSSQEKKKGKSLVEALLGDAEGFNQIAERLNLDPDMSQKIVVPILSLLDKYGIGESITSSPQLESASSTMEIIRDVAPVVKGAAEFISGKRAELKADDLAFLEEIKKSQMANDASLFSEEDEELFTIGESVNNAPNVPQTPQQPAPNFSSFGKGDWGDFWADATGANKQETFLDNDLTKQMEQQQSALEAWANKELGTTNAQSGPHTAKTEGVGGEFNLGDGAFADTFAETLDNSFGVLDVSALAKEAGLSVNEVMESDSQNKMFGIEKQQEDLEIDLSEFEEMEEKVEMDYTQFDVPEDAENFDPLHIQGFEIPEFEVNIEEFQEYLPEQFDEEENQE